MPKYGLQLLKTQQLLRVRIGFGDDGHQLTDEGDYPIFEVDSLSSLRIALMENPSSYNSSHDRPSWGKFRRGDFQPVEFELVVKMTPVELELPADFSERKLVIECRDTAKNVASRYAGRDIVAKRYVLVFTKLPNGMSYQQALSLEGKDVNFGYLNIRRCLAVCPLPEEYLESAEGREAALLICTDTPRL